MNETYNEADIASMSLKELAMHQMQSQAAINEETRRNDEIIFGALAAIYEKRQELKTMVEVYVRLILLGKRTIESVPVEFREEVERRIKENDNKWLSL